MNQWYPSSQRLHWKIYTEAPWKTHQNRRQQAAEQDDAKHLGSIPRKSGAPQKMFRHRFISTLKKVPPGNILSKDDMLKECHQQLQMKPNGKRWQIHSLWMQKIIIVETWIMRMMRMANDGQDGPAWKKCVLYVVELRFNSISRIIRSLLTYYQYGMYTVTGGK